MSNLIRTQILFPADVLTDLRLMAVEREWGLSETVRNLVREKIKKVKPKKINGAEAMLKMAAWAKKHKVTGPPDLSTNDEYLYGKLAPDYPLRDKKK
ncbi:hypothetical protein HZB78_03090 [Candidatus Collierbacteria bacterium]|nr:hypothetical protein [Candidatus Collierbacteria bacterium]